METIAGVQKWPPRKSEKVISEILVADTDSESGAGASNVEDDFEEQQHR